MGKVFKIIRAAKVEDDNYMIGDAIGINPTFNTEIDSAINHISDKAAKDQCIVCRKKGHYTCDCYLLKQFQEHQDSIHRMAENHWKMGRLFKRSP